MQSLSALTLGAFVSWNVRLLTTINNWSGNPVLDDLMKFCAKDLIFVIIAAVGLLALRSLRRHGLRPAVLTGIGLGAAFTASLVLAALHRELRPFQTHPVHVLINHTGGQSFPSDHATAAFAVAFAVLVFLSRRWGVALLLAATLVGLSRVYAGLHYPGDILGGALAALLGVALASVAGMLHRRASTPPHHPVGATRSA